MSQTKILVKQTTMHPSSLGMRCLVHCLSFRQNALLCIARDSLRFLAGHGAKLTVITVSLAEKSSISLSRSTQLSSCPTDLYTSKASHRLPPAESQPFPLSLIVNTRLLDSCPMCSGLFLGPCAASVSRQKSIDWWDPDRFFLSVR